METFVIILEVSSIVSPPLILKFSIEWQASSCLHIHEKKVCFHHHDDVPLRTLCVGNAKSCGGARVYT